MIAARLVTLAGSVARLARAPAGTVQLLGAERALFLTSGPGLDRRNTACFSSPSVNRAPPWQRGSDCASHPAKVTVARARRRHLRTYDPPDRLQASIETLEEIRRGKPKNLFVRDIASRRNE